MPFPNHIMITKRCVVKMHITATFEYFVRLRVTAVFVGQTSIQSRLTVLHISESRLTQHNSVVVQWYRDFTIIGNFIFSNNKY